MIARTNADFFSLQLGDGRTQAAGLDIPENFQDLSGWIGDFDDTAAIMANLDLVISSDTSTLHLAGALGRPCIGMLAADPDWRWGLKSNSSPWYPTMQLLRQNRLDDWRPVMRALSQELAGRFG